MPHYTLLSSIMTIVLIIIAMVLMLVSPYFPKYLVEIEEVAILSANLCMFMAMITIVLVCMTLVQFIFYT